VEWERSGCGAAKFSAAHLEFGEQGVCPHLQGGKVALAGYGGDRREVVAQLVRIDGVAADRWADRSDAKAQLPQRFEFGSGRVAHRLLGWRSAVHEQSSMFVGGVIAGHGVPLFLQAAESAGYKRPTAVTWSRPRKTFWRISCCERPIPRRVKVRRLRCWHHHDQDAPIWTLADDYGLPRRAT
jgi:hypothetical protein